MHFVCGGVVVVVIVANVVAVMITKFTLRVVE